MNEALADAAVSPSMPQPSRPGRPIEVIDAVLAQEPIVGPVVAALAPALLAVVPRLSTGVMLPP
jgi:hypothetical protein